MTAPEASEAPPRSTAREQARGLILAVQFLTRVPTPRLDIRDNADLRDSMGRATAYFPVVGAMIGLATGAVVLACLRVWPPWLAVTIGLAFEARLSGAFHEDAVADFCDAFGGGWTRDDVLRILKDSRLGTYGVLGLMLAVALRGGALASVEPGRLLAASAASACLGRWSALPAMWALPPLSDRQSLSRDVGRRLGLRRVAFGTLLAVPGCAAFAIAEPARMLAALAATFAVGAWLVRYVGRRLGGINGDSLGFLCYATQIVVLLAACAS
ncbi:adenosylcobinamide-GDP ribazoletransferase [Paludisphaera sp.]|uniref:adenosylcobinamide-GDP ribazoletransferase n=1 Tax=Paludisphaera sp. TaxID=2017432 RepID=UPI00301CDCD5